MKRKVVNLYGIKGEGATITEAKQRAGEQLTQFVQQSLQSKRGYLGGYFAGIERGYNGWEYWFFKEGETDAAFGECHFRVGCYPTPEQAESQLRAHIAQIQPTLEQAWAVCHDERQRHEVSEYFAWQAAYQEAASQGCDDTQARDFASQHQREYRRLYQP